jgi:lipoprotein-anchoring transpeptidase ErfK/SrfK
LIVHVLSRRRVVFGASFWVLGAVTASAEQPGAQEPLVKQNWKQPSVDPLPPPKPVAPVVPARPPQTSIFDALPGADEDYYDPALLPPPESETDFPVTPVKASIINPKFRRQTVAWTGEEKPGTVVVDPRAHFLYFVLPDGQAIRYGVGVGRQGFSWSGTAEIRMKRRWPRWVPPREMTYRDERAMQWKNGMPGGPNNPLGARALYLFADGQDTLYRIHGTNEPQTIGQSVSSGCIRMLNEDVADLFERVDIGTTVIVRS